MIARSVARPVVQSVARSVVNSSGGGRTYDLTNAIGAWNVRKIGTVSAVGRVRRSSDNLEQDFLDSASALAFVGGGSGYLTKLYDESGNAKDAVQATTTFQPRIVNSGVYDDAIVFDASDDYMGVASATAITGNYTISLWAKSAGWAGVTNVGLVAHWTGGSGYMLYVLSGKLRVYRDGEFFETASTIAAYNGQMAHIAVTANGTAISVYINGALFDSGNLATKTGQTPSGDLNIGSYAMGAGSPFGGSMRDIRVFSVAKTAGEILAIYGEAA